MMAEKQSRSRNREETEYFKVQTEKTNLEILAIKQEAEKPFFKKKFFIQAVVAGIALAPLFFFFIEPIYKLKEERLNHVLEGVSQKLEASAQQKVELNVLRQNLAKTAEKLNIATQNYEKKLRKQEEAFQKRLLTEKKNLSIQFQDDLTTQIQQFEVTRSEIHDLGKQLQTDLNKTIVRKIATLPKQKGWIYAGQYEDTWIATNLQIGSGLPVTGEKYIAAKAVAIRADKPSFPFYRMKKRVGTVNKEGTIKVIEIDPNVGRNRVWLRIETL